MKNDRKILIVICFMFFAVYKNAAMAGGVNDYFLHNEYNGNPAKSCPTMGTPNPINSGSGNKYHEELLFKGGGEFPLEFKLYYNSRTHEKLGNDDVIVGRWTYSYSQHVNIRDDLYGVNVELVREDGTSIYFQCYDLTVEGYCNGARVPLANEGAYPVNPAAFGKLKKNIISGNLSFDYISLDGFEEHYDNEGRLTHYKNIHNLGYGIHRITYDEPTATEPGEITVTSLDRGETLRIPIIEQIDRVTYDSGYSEKWQYIPQGLITPNGTTYDLHFDSVDWHGLYDNRNWVAVPRLLRVYWPNGTETGYTYHPFTVTALNTWHWRTALAEVVYYDESYNPTFVKNIRYNDDGWSTKSVIGSNDVSESHVVQSSIVPYPDPDDPSITIEGHARTIINRDGAAKTHTLWAQDMFNEPKIIKTTVHDDSELNVKGSLTSYTYDYLGGVDVVNKDGNVTDYDFITETGPYGTIGNIRLLDKVTYKGVDEGNDRVIDYDWTIDNDWSPESLPDVSQYRQIKELVTPGLTVSFDYEYGRIKRRIETDTTIDPPGYARMHSRTRRWEYNYTYYNDNLETPLEVKDVTEIDPLGGQTVYEYNEKGDISVIRPSTGGKITFYQHNDFGFPLAMIDRNFLITYLSYTPRGWLETIERDGKVTSFEYDSIGHISKITFPNSTYITYQYTDGGRLASITNQLGEKKEFTRGTGTGYEELVVKTFTSGGTEVGEQIQTYDALGRLWKMHDVSVAGAGTLGEYNYDSDGNVEYIKDGNGGQIQRVLDALGRVTEVIDYRDNTSVKYKYDHQDNVSLVTDQNSHDTSYHYDGFGNLLSMTSPDTGTTVYHYDDVGNIVQSTDADNTVIQYSYTPSSRLSSINYPTQEDVSYEYDSTVTDNTMNYGVGRLTAIVKAGGDKLEFVYDQIGNNTRDIRTIDGSVFRTEYSYDENDQLVSITYPSGATLLYENIAGVTRSISRAGVNIATNISYEPFGPVKGYTYGNGLIMSHEHDSHYRSSNIVLSNLLSLAYQYDSRGFIDLISDSTTGAERNQEPEYTPKGRLENLASAEGLFSYQYNNVGTRTLRSLTTSTSTYEESILERADNQWIDGVSGSVDLRPDRSFMWSPSGSLSQDTGRVFTYNEEGRLTEVKDSGNIVASYGYNPLGQRDTKNVAGEIRHFVYNLNGQLLWEGTADGNWQRDYIYLEGKLIALADTDKTGKTALYYVHSDHLGSPQIITNSRAKVVWDAVYRPFGEANILTASIENNIRFPGQYYDFETGLHYNYFRYYDPSLGRYITSDPIGLAGGMNTYAYVGANPLLFIDPLGLACSPGHRAVVVKNYEDEFPEVFNCEPYSSYTPPKTLPFKGTFSITVQLPGYPLGAQLACNADVDQTSAYLGAGFVKGTNFTIKPRYGLAETISHSSGNLEGWGYRGSISSPIYPGVGYAVSGGRTFDGEYTINAGAQTVGGQPSGAATLGYYWLW